MEMYSDLKGDIGKKKKLRQQKRQLAIIWGEGRIFKDYLQSRRKHRNIDGVCHVCRNGELGTVRHVVLNYKEANPVQAL